MGVHIFNRKKEEQKSTAEKRKASTTVPALFVTANPGKGDVLKITHPA
jgi:hypothetical protein